MHRYDYGGEDPVQEDFGYDDLNRLKWSEVSGRDRVSLDYDAWGNITHKSDVGDYRYGAECQEGAGPHALCETSDGQRYWYDANGSMVGDSSGRTIEYSSFDKPTKISKGGHTTRFAYSPSRSRYLRTDESEQGATTLTRYLGNVERITHPGGRLEIKRRLPGGALISYTRSADGQPAGKTTHYLHMDHLGSIDIISNEIGQLVARMSFDPWGQRRDPLNWGPLVDKALSELETNITGITKRGFTGHEMLDEVGLIHMNGRIYDPRLGRFMQADPLIDGVTDTQGYNRYSYVHNNPLNATDPSGFSAWTRFRDNFLKPVIQGIVTGVCIPCGAALAAATTLYYGGSVGDAAIAAFSTFAIASVGANISAPGGPGFGFNLETLGFATLGGITSALRGGKFGHGFVSAGAGALTSGYVQGIENAGVELIASTVIAGSISEATGGKFANGAAYAAFSWAVSQGTQRIANSKNDVRYESLGSSESHLSDVEKATAQMEITLAVEGIERQAFGSADLAAQALHEALSPIAKAWKIEIGAMIHDASPSCFCERVVVSDVTTDFLSGSVDIRPLSEFDRVASYHTHTITNMFSTPDFNKEVGGGIDGYLSTPSGRLLRFDHRAFLDGGLPRTKSNFEKYVSEVK